MQIVYNILRIENNKDGDKMNIDVRKYIIGNFKGEDKEELRKSLDMSVASHDEDPLIGMGVLMELAWSNSDEEFKNRIIDNISKGIEEKSV